MSEGAGGVLLWSARALALLSLLASLWALYVKIYFWGGTTYASLGVKVLLWALVLVGPLAVFLSIRWPKAALLLVAVHATTIALMSV